MGAGGAVCVCGGGGTGGERGWEGGGVREITNPRPTIRGKPSENVKLEFALSFE